MGGMSALQQAGQWLLIGFFLVSGLANLTKARIADHIERLRAYGMPRPAAAFWAGTALEFSGCALVIAGWHAELGVAALIAFTVVATAIFHRFWQKSDPVQRNFSRLSFLANAGILGGLLLLLDNVR
jgi:putative oxidoreductase